MRTPLRLRLALHAFPRRFRVVRATEIEATFDEAERAGEPHTYGAQALADVVLAGWSERYRTRPPWDAYLKYRVLGKRLAQRWHPWMLDDVRGWYWLRRLLLVMSPLLTMWIYTWIRFGVAPAMGQWPWIALVGSMWVVTGIVGARRDRTRILALHGYDAATGEWLPPNLVPLVSSPRSTAVSPLAFTMAAALAAVAPFAVLASAGLIGADHRRADGQLAITVLAFAIALLLGVLGATGHSRISHRVTIALDDASEADPAFSDLRAAGGVSAAFAALGFAVCWYPITPLMVPLLLVVAVGAIPVLVLLGRDARSRRVDGSVVVWNRRSTRTRAARRS